ncbi:MAG: hypothetical protein H6828_07600 [Planctomycetes bacterium]|nr:hypothetical protein [Planctomycetota bacterium]
MKNLALLLVGAGLGVALSALTSAGGSAPVEGNKHLRAGATVYGLNLVAGTARPLAGLADDMPVTVRAMDGDWLQVDFPAQKTGPVWVNQANVVSYRTSR